MPKLTLSDEHIKFVCGFCGADCVADTDPCVVLHYLPMCKQYEDLDPLEFLKASREEHERKGTNPTTCERFN